MEGERESYRRRRERGEKRERKERERERVRGIEIKREDRERIERRERPSLRTRQKLDKFAPLRDEQMKCTMFLQTTAKQSADY